MSQQPHEVLGVAPDADEETVRRAYKRLASQHHPDRNAVVEIPGWALLFVAALQR